MMDGDVLLKALEGSYSSNRAVRQQSEEYLLWFSGQQGSIPLLMNVCAHSQVGMELRMAAAIRLKNQVISSWEVSRSSGDSVLISDSDKSHLIENIYPLIISVGVSGRGIRRQCFELLRYLFFDIDVSIVSVIISQLLVDLEQRSDPDRLQCALLVLRSLSNRYEYHLEDANDQVEALLKVYLCPLLKIAEDACSVGLNNTDAAMLVHLTLKNYFSMALLTKTTTDILETTMDQWMNLLKFILKYFINSENVKSDIDPFSELGVDMEDEIGEMEQYKCLKWTLKILNRIASKTSTKRGADKKQPKSFYSNFTKRTHAVDIGKLIIQLLDVESNKRVTLTNLLHHSIWILLRHLSSISQLYTAFVQPNLEKIVHVYLVLTFAVTGIDLQNYAADPVNYLETCPEVTFQLYSHRGAAAHFLRDICRTRASHIFPVMYKLVTGAIEAAHVLNMATQSQDVPIFNDGERRIYAAFSILGHGGDRLFVRSKDRVMLGDIDGAQLMGTVTGIIRTSKNPWLVSRACWLSGVLVKKLRDNCNDEILFGLYKSLLELLSSQELIVSVLASGAICVVLEAQHSSLAGLISNSIGALLEKLFMLMERIELETVIGVLEVVADRYPEHTLLHAGPIVAKLTQHLQLAILNDADSNESPSEDQTLARWTMLQTLENVLCMVANARAKQDSTDVIGVANNGSLYSGGNPGTDICIISSTFGLLQTAFASGADSDQLLDYLDEFGLIFANLIRLIFLGMDADEPTRVKIWEIYYAFLKVVAPRGALEDSSDASSTTSPPIVGDVSALLQVTRALIHFNSAGFKPPISDAILTICQAAVTCGYPEEADGLLANIFDVACTPHLLPIDFVTGVMQLVTMRLYAVLEDLDYHGEFIRLVAVLLIYMSGEKNAETFKAFYASHLTTLVQFLVEAAPKILYKSTRKLVVVALCCVAKRGLYNIGQVNVCQIIIRLAEIACISPTNLEDDYEDENNDTADNVNTSYPDFPDGRVSVIAAPDPNFSATVAASLGGAPLGTLHGTNAKTSYNEQNKGNDTSYQNAATYGGRQGDEYDYNSSVDNYREIEKDAYYDFTGDDSSDFDDDDEEDTDEEWEPQDQYSSLKGINLHALVSTTLTELGSANSGVDPAYAAQILEKLACQN